EVKDGYGENVLLPGRREHALLGADLHREVMERLDLNDALRGTRFAAVQGTDANNEGVVARLTLAGARHLQKYLLGVRFVGIDGKNGLRYRRPLRVDAFHLEFKAICFAPLIYHLN